VRKPVMNKRYYYVKIAIDVIIAAIVLLILSPLLLIIALLIRLTSKGPVYFKQARLGQHGNIFYIHKFRTMIVNAPDIRNADGTTFNSANDSRVTSIGKFLRKTSLDELPQLIDVILLDMSIVGPRPELPECINIMSSEQKIKLDVKPGMTGWAVIHGRNNVPINERRNLDAWYAQNYSFLIDWKIIFKTFVMVLMSEGYINDHSKQHNKN